jgi:hypothetical protein
MKKYLILLLLLLIILFSLNKNKKLIETFEKKTCAYILRGFLYKKDWKPNSEVGKKYTYTQDIKKYWKYHKKLIDILSQKYKVDIYFITYDITPKEYINWANNIGKVILVPFKDSTQFGTLSIGLKKIQEYDILVINRTDIIYYEPFYNLVKKINDIENILLMNRVSNNVSSNNVLSNDIFFWIPKKSRKLFEKNLDFIIKKNKKDLSLHSIYKYMKVEYLFNIDKFVVRDDNIYYKLQNK